MINLLQEKRARSFILAPLLVLAALIVCQPDKTIAPAIGNDGTNTDPFIIVEILTSDGYYKPINDSFVPDTCLCFNVACVGSPMPIIQAIEVDDTPLTLVSRSFNYLGMMTGYLINVDIYKDIAIAVVTDRGTVTGHCSVPKIPPYIVSPNFGAVLTKGADQLFQFNGTCNYYHIRFLTGNNNLYGSTPAPQILLDTIITMASFLLPSSILDTLNAGSLDVALQGYNGELPFRVGAKANMTGNGTYGFVYAHNAFDNSWDSPDFFSVH